MTESETGDAHCTSDTDRDWPGAETWLCDGCDEPKPTDECWPCTTDDGQIVLCPDCRDERGVDPILPDGGQSAGGTDGIGELYELHTTGVCDGCGSCATVVSDGHHPVEGDQVEPHDGWVRCEWTDQRDCPEVVCLCGSTRFKDEYRQAERRLTMEGKIVLTCGLFGHADGIDLSDDEKEMLDDLHKRKIDRADRIHVINVGGYIGDSTRSEIEYARQHNKKISWLEPRKSRSLHTGTDRDTSTERSR